MGATVAAVRQALPLTSEQARQLRRALDRAERAEEELRSTVLSLIREGASVAAIARELGVSRQTLWARIQSWSEED
jgi:DNA-binding NarL/FixJ family response regulator